MPLDWNNIDVELEQHACLLDELSLKEFLLTVFCNLPEITETKVLHEFDRLLQLRMQDAREVFNANLKNITKQAKKERNKS